MTPNPQQKTKKKKSYLLNIYNKIPKILTLFLHNKQF